ncbi:MAG: hypothetical protein JST87_05140 [Bacteroidetes bacterium]|nr:hypothetical protein [Bacteroidota bacterium]MBS1935041.1 hypothetical protein [Bacteroidota bacterium]
MSNSDRLSFSERWSDALQVKPFRIKMIAGIILLILLLAFFPVFFQYIERRNGPVLHDMLLSNLPAFNMSVVIFLILWSATAYALITRLQKPNEFIVFLWAYIFVSLSRLLTISIFPLSPPVNLIELKDPLSTPFYGMKVVTKDLFYSGHTSSLFLIFLVMKKPFEKVLTLMATLSVAFLLMIQHVHYTIDIIAAPFFTYIFYRLAIRFSRSSISSSQMTVDS